MCLFHVHFSVPHCGKKTKKKQKSVSVSAGANLGVSGWDCEGECETVCEVYL